MSAMQDVIARVEREAARAVANDITVRVDEMVAEAGFKAACLSVFGEERGRRFWKAGNPVVRDEAEKVCDRIFRKLAAGRGYSTSEHLAAKALYEAARRRIVIAEERAKAVAQAAE